MNKTTGEAQAGLESEPKTAEQDKHDVHPELTPYTGLKKYKMREKMSIEIRRRVRKNVTARARNWNTDDVADYDLEP